MPELPEVETIKNCLQPLIGLKVASIIEICPAVVKRRDFPSDVIIGRPTMEISRRGKYLILSFSDQHFLVIHLGMSGRLYWTIPGEKLAKHTHFIIGLEGNRELRYEDARRFGGIRFIHDLASFFYSMGPEPLGADFGLEQLRALLSSRRAAVKTLLLDQRLIAGIGNIYADEVLFAAGIHPARPAGELSEEEIERLYISIRDVLAKGISHRGTTFRDYRDGLNQPGGFQDFLMVYSRTGQPCPVCGHPVEKMVIGGRSSHYCPKCQS